MSPGVSALLALTACLLWSTAFVGVKYGLRYAGPFTFAGARFVLSGLLLFPLCGGWSVYRRSIVRFRKTILRVCFFQTFLLYALFYTGMTLVEGALGAIVIGSSPLISALTAHFFMPGDEMTWKKSASIALGISGVILIAVSREPWTTKGLYEGLGVLLLILGAFSSAMANVIVARDSTGIPSLILNSAQITLGGILLLLVGLPLEGLPAASPPAGFYLALVWLAFISAVSISIWFVLLKLPETKVSELNLWKFVIPVCGAILSWWLLPEESPSLIPVIGMVCVALSIIFYNIKRTRLNAVRRHL
jgi:drug/metabolite transporter (DMT)-like permease